MLVVNQGSDDIGGKQVGRELYTAEFCVHSRSHSFYGEGFRQTGDALKQDVPVCKNSGKEPVDKVFLTHYGFCDFVSEQESPIGRRFYFVIYFAEVCAHIFF